MPASGAKAAGAAGVPGAGAAPPQPGDAGRPALGRVPRGRGPRLAPAGAQAPAGRPGRHCCTPSGLWLSWPSRSACDVLEFRAAVEQEPARAGGLRRPAVLRGLLGPAGARSSTNGSPRPGTRCCASITRRSAELAREAMAQWRWREAVGLGRPVAGERPGRRTRPRSWPWRPATCSGNRARRARGATPSIGTSCGTRPAASRAGRSRRWSAGWRPTGAQRDDAARSPTSGTLTRPTFEASLVGREPQWKALTAAWKRPCAGTDGSCWSKASPAWGSPGWPTSSCGGSWPRAAPCCAGRSYDRRAGIPYEPVVEALRGALAAPGLAGTVAGVAGRGGAPGARAPRALPGAPRPTARRRGGGLAAVRGRGAARWPRSRPSGRSRSSSTTCSGATRTAATCSASSPGGWSTRRCSGSASLTLGEVERDAPAVAALPGAPGQVARRGASRSAPLSEEEVWQLVREMGHVSAPTGGRRFAARLFRITAGNPFYVIELLKTMFAQGLLADGRADRRMDGGARTRSAPGARCRSRRRCRT